jgi:hypothetical protein
MSTRCNIVIKDEYDEEVILYRHSDGYPTGALPTLTKFMEWVHEGRIRDNVQQAAGWLILIGADEYSKTKSNICEPGNDSFSGWCCGSYEPATRIQGDIRYLYTLDLVKQTINIKTVNGFSTKDLTRLEKPKYRSIRTIYFGEKPVKPERKPSKPKPVKKKPVKKKPVKKFNRFEHIDIVV